MFSAGRVVAAYRTGQAQPIGERLLESGAISPSVYQELLAAQARGVTGTGLLELAGKHKESLLETLQEALKETVYGMFEWNEGTFSFVLETEPDMWRGFALDDTRSISENGLNPQYLAIEGARLRDEKNREDSLQNFLSQGKSAQQENPTEPPPDTTQSFAEELGNNEALAKLVGEQGAAATAQQALAQAAPDNESHSRLEPETQPADNNTATEAGGEATAQLEQPGSADAKPDDAASDSGEEQTDARDKVIPFPAVRAASGGAQAAPPSAEERAAPASAEERAPPAASNSSAAGASRDTLIVIDDDPQVLHQLQKLFRETFGRVLAYDNVQEALAALDDVNGHRLAVASDLIIARSDGKGILGGVQVLEAVRDRSNDVPVVLFSDYQNEQADGRARELGVEGLLTKPRKAQIAADAGVIQAFLDALRQLLEPHAALEAPLGAAMSPRGSASDAEAPADVEAASDSAEASQNAGAGANAAGGAGAQTDSTPEPSDAHNPAAQAYDLGMEIAREMGDEAGDEQELPPPSTVNPEMGNLRSMLAELIDPANRETVTLLVLRYASYVVERAALFLATRRVYIGLGGFSIEESSEGFVKRVRKMQIPVEHPSVFDKVSRYRSMVRGALPDNAGNRLLIDGLGGSWPNGATVAAPLISGDRVAAILYGDCPSGSELGSTDSLEIFLQQAGLAMDRALLERKLEEAKHKRGSDN